MYTHVHQACFQKLFCFTKTNYLGQKQTETYILKDDKNHISFNNPSLKFEKSG